MKLTEQVNALLTLIDRKAEENNANSYSQLMGWSPT